MGKKDRKVPVLVPPDCTHILDLILEDPLHIGSEYLFAIPDNPNQVYNSSESLAKAVMKAECQNPDVILSTTLRKFLSTTMQVMNLSKNEVKWVMDRLGHSVDVDEQYYKLKY